mmetsp:Transcript_160/g.179  ORF Transcript_160/g.179 Transcript_160/m.179 type:complete len:417 (-) Transcript_160:93-1343(-)
MFGFQDGLLLVFILFNQCLLCPASDLDTQEACSTKMLMSEETIRIVNATAMTVAENALEITTVFYSNLIERNPEVLYFFNMANQHTGEQQKTLAHGVVAFGLYITNLVVLERFLDEIAQKHVALSVKPEHYSIVHDNLMLSIGQVLGDIVSPAIGKAWSEAITALAHILIEKEEHLYQLHEKRQGGWRYEREFIVSKKHMVSEDVLALTFQPEDGYSEGFDFEPGQYTTIHLIGVDSILSPRHYAITSKIGANEFEIAARILPNGLMTNYMHNTMQIGEKCLLSAPSGTFGQRLSPQKNILISGGIGITTMKSFFDYLGPEKVVKVVHIERSESKHAFRDYFLKSKVEYDFIYTNQNGRPNVVALAQELFDFGGSETHYHVCAPPYLMIQLQVELQKAGATNINVQKYSPGAPKNI